MRLFYYLILITLCCSACQQSGSSSLTVRFLHNNWQFSAADSLDWREAQVPGVVHSDLLRHQLIPDPWYGLNEQKVQWIEDQNWLYKSQFELSEAELSRKQIDLVCEGLDTYAELKINGQRVLTANNMFRSWRISARPYLRAGNNELEILFKSPLEINKDKVASLGYKLPAGSETGPLQVSPFTRKAPYHFGWDWGPRLLTAGIWRPIYLESWDAARIEQLQIVQESLTDKQAKLKVKIGLKTASPGNYFLHINEEQHALTLSPGDSLMAFDYYIQEPKRWWPNGWGEAHLYPFHIQLTKDGKTLDEQEERIGLRTVELIQEKDSIGSAFYFNVNGHRIFIKGANYIPQSSFLPAVKAEDYQQLIADAKASNMNMLRVWGGGIYENDLFYKLCDEAGILVWQDFMFAGSMYPGDTAFLNNVREEVRDNIRRLRNHPCIAIWNGNNEMEVAWFNWGWQQSLGYSPQDSAKIWQDYQQIFHQLIPNQLKELDPQRAYTSTSPLSNWGKDENFNHHSMHYWGVWHGKDHFEDYRSYVGRFMAEYGFQSFPNLETVRAFAPDTAQYLESEIMQWHQKSYIGNEGILRELTRYFPKPLDFPDFINKSQQTQALGMRIAIDAHRLRRAHCGGTLFWQWNDCWPGPSWSARDVYGRPKQFLKDLPVLFATTALIPQLKGQTLEVYAVNDGLKDLSLSANLSIKTSNNEVLYEENRKIQLKGNSIELVLRLPLHEVIPERATQDCIISTQLSDNKHQVIFSRSDPLDWLK